MSLASEVKVASAALPQPEPGLTAETVIARAAALRPLLREKQKDSNWLGHYGPEIHKAIDDAGLYRILHPKMFGGYEFGPKTFIRAIMEISRGHPGSGWCYTLGASHAYLLASYWPEDVQRELFGATGEFRAAFPGIPTGTLIRTEGGYTADGVWPFASGAPIATHFMAGALAPTENGPLSIVFVTPIENVTILPDWGKDQYMGMQASGSNSVKVDKLFVPDRYIVSGTPDQTTEHLPDGTPGTRLHKNGIYLGVRMGWFNTEFGAILTGTARAALDEFSEMATTKRVLIRPDQKMIEDASVQETYGRAVALTDSAEALTLAAVDLYEEFCARFMSEGRPFTTKDSFRIWGIASNACRMACEAVEILFHASGGSTGRRDKRLHQYFQDITTYRLHPQSAPFIPQFRGAFEFGLAPPNVFGRQPAKK